MILPSNWTPFRIVFYLVFGLFAVFLGLIDYYELLPMKYSKFGTKKGVPSRLGMVTLYFFPLIVATLAARPYFSSANTIQWVVYGAVMLHFTKRTLESLLLHKYSGRIAPLTFGIIVIAYALMGGMISWLNVEPLQNMDILFYLGFLFVLVGEIGNFYHHRLLANLRTGKEKYYIPKGGWFEYATCPHYFFELVVWLGIFFLSRHFFTLLVFIAMLSYLTARSIKTRQWYRNRFPNYPKDRKYMIPFLF